MQPQLASVFEARRRERETMRDGGECRGRVLLTEVGSHSAEWIVHDIGQEKEEGSQTSQRGALESFSCHYTRSSRR